MSPLMSHPHPSSGKPAHGRMLVVLPVISTETADLCIDSILRPDSAAELDAADILVIDNTREGLDGRYPIRTYRDPDGHNLGVGRAWNVGIREVLASDREYVVLMSASMLFGPILHTSWTRQMLAFWGSNVIEADGHSWHLIALHRRLFERIGLFDPAYYPAYEEAVDWAYRLRMLDLERDFARVWVNALSQGSAMHNQIVACPNDPLRDVYAAKWGGQKGEEKWSLPYGDKPLDFITEEPIPVLAERYGLGKYGEGWW